MGKGKRAAATLLACLMITALTTGCREKTELAPPEKNYIKWTKVADGVFSPFTMPEYMNTKGLFLQSQGVDGPEQIFYADLGHGRAELVNSGFDLNREMQRAQERLVEKGVDLNGFTAQYLPKRNVLILTAHGPQLWVYQIENGQLVQLGDASYAGVDYETARNLALEKWDEAAYLYPYADVTPSPDEHFLAFSSGMSLDGRQLIYFYNMDKQMEQPLLAEGAGTGLETYTLSGWVNDQWLLCVKEGPSDAEDGTLVRQFILAGVDGTELPLELPANAVIQRPEGDSRLVVKSVGEDGTSRFSILKIREDGSVETLADNAMGQGSAVDEIQVSGLGDAAAFVTAPDGQSFDRQLRVIHTKDGTQRTIAAPNVGGNVKTSLKSCHWIDENRMFILLREEWQGQETFSAWVLDLRSKSQSSPEGVDASSGVEMDSVRETDMAGNRDAAVLAEAYGAAVDLIFQEAAEMNGGDGELKYIALDTSEVINLSEEQKAALLQLLAERYQAQVLDKSYVQLKAEGYLDESGRFADGMLFHLAGGYFNMNEMKLSGFKWRSVNEKAELLEISLRFSRERWDCIT